MFSSQCSCYYTLCVYFISCKAYEQFPVWWAQLHWRSNGTYRGLETFVQWIWQIRFYPRVNQSFRRKQPISHIKRTTRTRFCKCSLFGVSRFPIDIFISFPLKSHCVVKLNVNERLNNFCASFPFSSPINDEPYHLLDTLAFLWIPIFSTFSDFPVR